MDNLETVSGRDNSGLTKEVYALLAQANLLRMRGCWEEAVENCMAALRLTPDSPSAQSLLGDIYENQGRRDDAIQWYRMALDLNPLSTADRVKLERLLSLQSDGAVRSRLAPSAGASAQSISQTAPGSETTEDAQAWEGTGRRIRVKSETALRITAWATALLTFIVIASAYVSVHRHAALSALGLATDPVVKTPLVVLSSTDSPTSASTPSAILRDASEQSLFDSLRASQDLNSSGIVVYDVEAEPRTAKLTLTFGVSPGGGGAPTRDIVLRSALRLLQAASALPGAQSTNSFTVRCLLPQTGGNGPPSAALAFVGDVPRSAIPPGAPDALGLSAAQVQTVFSAPWWSSLLPG